MRNLNLRVLLVSAVVSLILAGCGGVMSTPEPTAIPSPTPKPTEVSPTAAPSPTATSETLSVAPDFTLKQSGGGTFTLSEQLARGPVVLAFFRRGGG